jgi:hypothetical protein
MTTTKTRSSVRIYNFRRLPSLLPRPQRLGFVISSGDSRQFHVVDGTFPHIYHPSINPILRSSSIQESNSNASQETCQEVACKKARQKIEAAGQEAREKAWQEGCEATQQEPHQELTSEETTSQEDEAAFEEASCQETAWKEATDKESSLEEAAYTETTCKETSGQETSCEEAE